MGGRRPVLSHGLTVAFLAIGAAVLTAAACRWLIRQRMLAERGTAYVIEEQTIGWQPEEKDSPSEAGSMPTCSAAGPARPGLAVSSSGPC